DIFTRNYLIDNKLYIFSFQIYNFYIFIASIFIFKIIIVFKMRYNTHLIMFILFRAIHPW
ncbi:hypothetical protein B4U16_30430, partial [Klebsiella pneumoniae]